MPELWLCMTTQQPLNLLMLPYQRWLYNYNTGFPFFSMTTTFMIRAVGTGFGWSLIDASSAKLIWAIFTKSSTVWPGLLANSRFSNGTEAALTIFNGSYNWRTEGSWSPRLSKWIASSMASVALAWAINASIWSKRTASFSCLCS